MYLLLCYTAGFRQRRLRTCTLHTHMFFSVYVRTDPYPSTRLSNLGMHPRCHLATPVLSIIQFICGAFAADDDKTFSELIMLETKENGTLSGAAG